MPWRFKPTTNDFVDPDRAPSLSKDGVIGQLWQMERVIRRDDADNEVKEQYFTIAGSQPVKWLGNRYSYSRRKLPGANANR